jgi:MFS family permease
VKYSVRLRCGPRLLGLLSRWGEGAAFNTWGVFAISYATGTLHLARVPVLIAVTVAALLMAVLLPVSGLLADRFGPRLVYASGIAAYGLAVFPVFALFNTHSITAYALGMLLVFGVIHAWFYGAQGTLYASLFPRGSATPACPRCISCPVCTRPG